VQDSQRLAAALKAKALENGADLAGIAPALPPPEAGAYDSWLSAGMHGTMAYMARNADCRRDITRWYPEAKSVLVCAFGYSDGAALAGEPGRGRLARYAILPDYHPELAKRMRTVLDWFQGQCPDAEGRVFVDTSPVLERAWARRAGIAWIGKNTMAVSPKIGSYFFLAGLAINRELAPDEPMADHCGTCRRCREACPTKAFPRERVLDARRCVSYLTIEHRGAVPPELRPLVGDRVLGCDACQEACPWNRFASAGRLFKPIVKASIPLEDLASLDDATFHRRFSQTPVVRAKLHGLLRNALLAMGNGADSRHRPALERLGEDRDPVLSEQAAWSLTRLALLLCALLLPADLRALPEAGITQEPPPVQAVQPAEKPSGSLPPFLRWMIHPLRRGMLINLPIIDTNPNRGTTYGVMPVWVIQGKNEDRIVWIHAPSLTYNKDFGLNPTYRLFYYPTPTSSLIARGNMATDAEKEAMVQYQDRTFLGKDLDVYLRLQFNVDGSNRFFGLGPDSPEDAESGYTEDVLQYDVAAGIPLVPGTPWMIHLGNRLAGEKIYNGKVKGLSGIDDAFPGLVPSGHQQVMESRLFIGYDSRDNAVTTTRGTYLQTYAAFSDKKLASAFHYSRYGLEARYFHPWPQAPRQVSAVQVKYDQLLGDAPFWLLPSIGGKYNIRAYGAGRYIDRGSLFLSVEQRITVIKTEMAGVTTEFEVSPFAGVGEVFDSPKRLADRYARPVVGAAVRAVARPQVVGSIDVGVGQEGAKVFMDINYSF